MSDGSKIEWTDATWNPIRARHVEYVTEPGDGTRVSVGWYCEHVSSGCEFCYAEGINHRLGTGLAFKPGHRKDVEVFLDENMLLAPLKWKRPRRIFVCSMTDLFGSWVADEWLDRIFAVMALCPQHTFQCLTKRPARMREYINSRSQRDILDSRIVDAAYPSLRAIDDIRLLSWDYPRWPLPSVWLGVSAEDQATADERIPLLLDTPAAIRFVSLEPLLGEINLNLIGEHQWNVLDDGADDGVAPVLDWVIIGGESGPKARPMHPDWARSLRDQCQAAGVPFFFKQRGELTWEDKGWSNRAPDIWLNPISGRCVNESEALGGGRWTGMFRVGKKAAGRLLDGVEHNAYPEVV